jgi:membrane-anchored protein YejM (alkaline phosphatase superfamily)
MRLIIAFLFLFAFSTTQAQRVLVIGIDGTRSDALTAAFTPNIDALINAGVYSLRLRNHLVSGVFVVVHLYDCMGTIKESATVFR